MEKVIIKNSKHLLHEYGKILRWWNGDDRHDSIFYIEDVETLEKTYITNQDAIDYIAKRTLPIFRNEIHMYKAHVELFNILGIQTKKTFKDLLKEKEFSGYQFAKITQIPQSTISDWITGKKNILKAEFSNIITVCRTLEITAEELYNYLTKNR